MTTTTSQCPDLTGSYKNYGVWDNETEVLLAGIFFTDQELQCKVSSVTHVTFDNQGDDGLVVKAWVGDELINEHKMTVSQLTCFEERIVYHDTDWIMDGIAPFIPVVAHSSIDHLIYLASDGSMVMQNQEFSTGVALFIPLALKA